MRKQDRMTGGERQTDQPRQSESEQQFERRPTEQMKGSASEEPRKPERRSGKLPLPD